MTFLLTSSLQMDSGEAPFVRPWHCDLIQLRKLAFLRGRFLLGRGLLCCYLLAVSSELLEMVDQSIETGVVADDVECNIFFCGLVKPAEVKSQSSWSRYKSLLYSKSFSPDNIVYLLLYK